DASTGSITSWSWSFGDGGTSTSQNPSHTYTTAGTYTVALTVTGPGGSDTETKTGYITVNEPAPTAEFSGSPTSGVAPLAVSFGDASTGSITSWSWSFGDGGTSTSQNPSHTYTTAGTYTVALTVTGPGGSDTETKTGYITVNEPAPTAEFSGSPTSGTAPLAVTFGDASTGSITSWSWTFGDGGTSNLQNPSHTYTAGGSYTVALSVTGPGGSDTETKASYIIVTDPAPVAEFSGTPTSGTNPLTVAFTDLTTGPVTSLLWDFGDGGTSTAQNPSHTYTSVGTYTVKLTATGPGGSDMEAKTDYITVDPAVIGTNYCSPNSPNSTGSPASIVATGSEVVADNDVTLNASSMPLNQFGYFLASSTQGFIANPGGSAGNFCLGSGPFLGRYNGMVQNSGATGTFSITVDLNAVPIASAPGTIAIQPGDTWNFQGWYRDGATSNFTDGVSIVFQ
ncbi:MAG: PKD domain-containing protein, partial [bacterium]|nr:PKD domain-containing protein [bacterium]